MGFGNMYKDANGNTFKTVRTALFTNNKNTAAAGSGNPWVLTA